MTVIAPFGRVCYHHLPFGTTSTPEHFQCGMLEILSGLVYGWERVAFFAHASVEVGLIYTDSDLPFIALWDHNHSFALVCGLFPSGDDTLLLHP